MKKQLGIEGFAGFTVGLVILVLVTFAILQWLGIPTGNFLDWIVGTASFWWLVAVVTIPWNVYFNAKEVLSEAQESQQKGIEVEAAKMQYVQVIVRRSLAVAVGLHGVSAIALYLLAVTGVSAIGYVSSGAALLLTGLRPAVAFYQYLAFRLQSIARDVKYPREDILEVRDRLRGVEALLERLRQQLDPDLLDSLTATQQRQLQALRQDLTDVAASQESLRVRNQSEHEQLARDAEAAISRLNADAEFLDRARELIRFFKEA